MQKDSRRVPLPGLTALRFFAASYVLLFHFYPRPPADVAHPTLFYRWIQAGFTGVSCFFILSGFILAYTHEHVPEVGRFFRARFARVYPLYLFALVCSLPSFFQEATHLGHGALWALPASLLLIQTWFPHLAFAINPPGWTLSCEAFFYAIFPWVVRLLSRHRRHPWLWITACWAFQLLPPLLNNYLLPSHHPQWTPWVSDLLVTPLSRVGEFLAGIFMGLHFNDMGLHVNEQELHFNEKETHGNKKELHGNRKELHGSERNASRRSPTVFSSGNRWLLPLSLFICLCALSCNLTLPHEVVRNGLMLGPYCLLIWALAGSRSRLLASWPLQIGGEISYGVYLLQIPWLHALFALHRWFAPRFTSAFWLLTIYPIAWITYTTIEKPCRSLILRRKPSTQDKPTPTPQPELP